MRRLPMLLLVPLALAATACEPVDEDTALDADQANQPVVRDTGRAAGSAQEEAENIRELNRQWVQAVEQRDAEAIRRMYAEDGMIAPPNAPQATGRQAVGETWESFFEIPGLELSFSDTEINVSEARDMAYDIGTYEMSWEGQGGERMDDEGKYLVVWTRENGEWKVAADMFNSDRPAQQ